MLLPYLNENKIAPTYIHKVKRMFHKIRLTYAHFFRNFRLLLSQNKTKAWKITS